MAPSVASHPISRVPEDEELLDAEIMKAIRNSLKELNITSPSRPNRPPPGSLAPEEEYPESEGCSPMDDPISMITKADLEKDLQESLREILIIQENEDPEDGEGTDEDEVSEATLASPPVSAIDEEDDRSSRSSNSTHKK